MAGFCMKRGQATVEFLLTIVISLLLIIVVVMPNYESASKDAKDVVNLSKLRVSAEKLVNSIEFVSVSGNGTKQTIELVVPSGGQITFTGSGGSPPNCSAGSPRNALTMAQTTTMVFSTCTTDGDDDNLKCTKSFPVPTYFCAPPANITPGIYTAMVNKSNGVVYVTITQI